MTATLSTKALTWDDVDFFGSDAEVDAVLLYSLARNHPDAPPELVWEMGRHPSYLDLQSSHKFPIEWYEVPVAEQWKQPGKGPLPHETRFLLSHPRISVDAEAIEALLDRMESITPLLKNPYVSEGMKLAAALKMRGHSSFEFAWFSTARFNKPGLLAAELIVRQYRTYHSAEMMVDDDLDDLRSTGSPQTRHDIISHPFCPNALRDQVLQTALPNWGKDAYASLAANPRLSAQHLETLLDFNRQDVYKALAANRTTPPSILSTFLRGQRGRFLSTVKMNALSNPATPIEDVMTYYSIHEGKENQESRAVRTCVAMNPQTSEDIAVRAYMDSPLPSILFAHRLPDSVWEQTRAWVQEWQDEGTDTGE